MLYDEEAVPPFGHSKRSKKTLNLENTCSVHLTASAGRIETVRDKRRSSYKHFPDCLSVFSQMFNPCGFGCGTPELRLQ
jgi:hypothetical protein